MADSPTLNQTLGRRRKERAAEQLMQDSVNRLSNIAIDGLEVWQVSVVRILDRLLLGPTLIMPKGPRSSR
jgi:hypothetical protein